MRLKDPRDTNLNRLLNLLRVAVCVIASAWGTMAMADSADLQSFYAAESQWGPDLEIRKKYALGMHRFDVDSHTEILGWQISDSWYIGRQDGLDSGLTLVWQQKANQVSISKDGLRLTHRF